MNDVIPIRKSTGNPWQDGCDATDRGCTSTGAHWVDCPNVQGCTNPDHTDFHPVTQPSEA